MKKFLEMIEIVRGQSFIPSIPVFSKKGGKSTADGPPQIYEPETFYHLAEHCVPFVFSPRGGEPLDLPETADIGQVQKLDAPFKIFSIEILGGSISVPKDLEVPDIIADEKGERIGGLTVECIMVVEQSPNEYLNFGYLRTTENRVYVLIMPQLHTMVSEMLKRLSREETGVESVRERVRIGSGQNKRVATFRKVVHVRPKKLLTAMSHGTRNIDWSHRWAVRGHWRAVAGLGKDRDGNYSVEGHTWVSEHVRGPESAPLIPKVRIVE